MTKLVLITSLFVSITACGKKDDGPAATPSTAAPKVAEAPSPTAAAAAPAPALAAVKLDAAGAGWQGFTVQGPAGTEVTDSGTGGVILNFPGDTSLQIGPVENVNRKDFKKALELNAKVSYSVDTAEELAFTTETDMGGNVFTGFGFTVVVAAGGKKIECGSTYDDEATANRMKDVCRSLAKS